MGHPIRCVALGHHLGDALEVDTDEQRVGLGGDGRAVVATSGREDLASLDPLERADEAEIAMQRRRVAVADGQRARHAGLAAQGLCHPEHLVECGGDDAPMNGAWWAFVGRAEASVYDDLSVPGRLDSHERRDRIRHPNDRAVVEVGVRITASVS